MTPKIRLEKIEKQDDFSYFSALAFNQQVMVMNMGRVFTEEEADAVFSYMLEYGQTQKNAGSYKVFSQDDAFIGIGSLWVREDGTEAEYMVLPEYWNQGYATAIVASLIEKAREHPSVKSLTALVDPANIPSQKVLAKNGFTYEKTLPVEEDNSTVAVYRLSL